MMGWKLDMYWLEIKVKKYDKEMCEKNHVFVFVKRTYPTDGF